MFKNFSKLLPTILFILVAVIVSMMALSYFNISLAESGTSVLSRKAVFEGMCSNQHEGQKKVKAD